MLETLIGLVVVQVVTQVVSYLGSRRRARDVEARLTAAAVNREAARQETAAHIRVLQEQIDKAVAQLPKKRARKPKAEQ